MRCILLRYIQNLKCGGLAKTLYSKLSLIHTLFYIRVCEAANALTFTIMRQENSNTVKNKLNS